MQATKAKKFTIVDSGHSLRNEEQSLFDASDESFQLEELLHLTIHYPGTEAEAARFLRQLEASLSDLAKNYSVECIHSFIRPFSIEALGLDAWNKAAQAKFAGYARRITALFELLARAAALAHKKGILSGYLTSRHILGRSKSHLLVDTRILPFDPDLASDEMIQEQPPEMLAQGSVMLTSCCDCYAIGNLMFQIICSQQPHLSKADQLVHDIVQKEPEFACNLNPLASGSLAAICERALARKVYWRYQEAGELADDLRDYLEHKRTRATRSRRRRTVRAGTKLAFAAFFVILSIIGIIAFWPVLNDLQQDYDIGTESFYDDSGGGY
ncbi:MAG: hypothetical protein AAF483_18880 [Planctomycetota bacterium]